MILACSSRSCINLQSESSFFTLSATIQPAGLQVKHCLIHKAHLVHQVQPTLSPHMVNVGIANKRRCTSFQENQKKEQQIRSGVGPQSFARSHPWQLAQQTPRSTEHLGSYSLPSSQCVMTRFASSAGEACWVTRNHLHNMHHMPRPTHVHLSTPSPPAMLESVMSVCLAVIHHARLYAQLEQHAGLNWSQHHHLCAPFGPRFSYSWWFP